MNKHGFKLVGLYENFYQKIECKCKDNHICYTYPRNFVNGHINICSKCKNVNSKESGELKFLEYVTKIGGTLLEYNGRHKRSKCICIEGHKCKPYPKNVYRSKNGNICKICSKCDSNVTKANFIRAIDALKGKVVGKYVNTKTGVDCICKNNHVCCPTPNDIIYGNQGMCIKCAKNCPEQSAINFTDNIKKLEGEVIGEYVDAHTSVKCKCKNGHICYPNPNNIRSGQGMCVVCKESKGERMISKILDKLEIKYKTQISLNSLDDSNRYKYDFGGKDYFIEYDGIQHFEYVDFFHRDEKQFDKRRKDDIVKTENAIKNKIKIIRIDYTWINKLEICEQFIKDSFNSTELLCVSNKGMYKWLTN